MKGVKLTSSMWIYAIYSTNAELIRYLEDNYVWPPSRFDELVFINLDEEILKKSIKYQHNDISNYIIDNLMKEETLQYYIEKQYYYNRYLYAVEFHNYCFFPENMKYKNMFNYLCEFDY